MRVVGTNNWPAPLGSARLSLVVAAAAAVAAATQAVASKRASRLLVEFDTFIESDLRARDSYLSAAWPPIVRLSHSSRARAVTHSSGGSGTNNGEALLACVCVHMTEFSEQRPAVSRDTAHTCALLALALARERALVSLRQCRAEAKGSQRLPACHVTSLCYVVDDDDDKSHTHRRLTLSQCARERIQKLARTCSWIGY